MKKYAPKIPDIYDHKYNLNDDKISKNETYGKIMNGKIPHIVYNHLMIKKKKSYVKTCFTQRNKKKLLTIVYFSP